MIEYEKNEENVDGMVDEGEESKEIGHKRKGEKVREPTKDMKKRKERVRGEKIDTRKEGSKEKENSKEEKKERKEIEDSVGISIDIRLKKYVNTNTNEKDKTAGEKVGEIGEEKKTIQYLMRRKTKEMEVIENKMLKKVSSNNNKIDEVSKWKIREEARCKGLQAWTKAESKHNNNIVVKNRMKNECVKHEVCNWNRADKSKSKDKYKKSR